MLVQLGSDHVAPRSWVACTEAWKACAYAWKPQKNSKKIGANFVPAHQPQDFPVPPTPAYIPQPPQGPARLDLYDSTSGRHLGIGWHRHSVSGVRESITFWPVESKNSIRSKAPLVSVEAVHVTYGGLQFYGPSRGPSLQRVFHVREPCPYKAGRRGLSLPRDASRNGQIIILN